MLTISPVYENFLRRRAREWKIKVDINGVEYGADQIVEIGISNEIGDGNDGFAIGTANISVCTLKLRTVDTIPPNAKVVPYVALSLGGITWDTADFAWEDADFAWDGSTPTEWLPLGTFYIDNRKQKNKVWTFECYDVLTFADVEYLSGLDYPATMQAVWDEVCELVGIEYDNSVQINPSYTVPVAPTGFTCRQVLGFIAGAHGASVYANRYGQVAWRKYTKDDSPVYDMSEADYTRVEQTNPLKTYTRIVVVYDEDDELTYEAGEGDENHTLRIVNPLMTQEMTNQLLQQISGISYVPIRMDARGYPHLEHGDRISFDRTESISWLEADVAWEDADFPWDGVQSYETLILQQSFTFKGGLGMSIDSPSKSEQKSEFGIDGSLTAAVKRLNKNAVRYGKPYYGVTHSRTEGIVVQREDNKARAVFNADELSFYANGTRALWFDIQNARFKFAGTLEGVDGTFTGTVQGGSFVGGNITIGSGNNVFRAGSQGIWAGNSNFNNAPFRVNMQGEMTAMSGTFGGTLQAAGGTFTGTLQGGSVIIGSGNNVFRADSEGIWAGNSNFNNAPFQVDMSGRLRAIDGEFSGTINATSGTIGGWAIQSGLLFGGMLLGGTIRGGEIETQPPGVYPRIALSASSNMLTFEGSSTGYFRVYPVGPVFQLEIVHGSSWFYISKGSAATTIQVNDRLNINAPNGVYVNNNPI